MGSGCPIHEDKWADNSMQGAYSDPSATLDIYLFPLQCTTILLIEQFARGRPGIAYAISRLGLWPFFLIVL